MSQNIRSFFTNKWWSLILALFISGILLFLSIRIDHQLLIYICYFLFGISILGLLAIVWFSLYEKKWGRAIFSFLISGVSVFCLIAYWSLSGYYAAPPIRDHWADSLHIPTGISLEQPSESLFQDTRTDTITLIKKSTDFQLYTTLQSGVYTYIFWTSKIDSGKVYLKAYEITREYALSADNVASASTANVYNAADSIIKISPMTVFSINEGDQDKAYAARFELWFKPADGSPEKKLLQKNYIITGFEEIRAEDYYRKRSM